MAALKISHVLRAEEHLPNTLRQVLVYEALGESAVSEPLTDRDVVTTAARNVFVQVVADDLRLGQLAVYKDPQTVCSARTVVSNDDMRPGFQGNRFHTANPNRISRPEVNQ